MIALTVTAVGIIVRIVITTTIIIHSFHPQPFWIEVAKQESWWPQSDTVANQGSRWQRDSVAKCLRRVHPQSRGMLATWIVCGRARMTP